MAFFTTVFTMKIKELWQTNVQKFRGLSLYVTFDYTVRDVKKGFFFIKGQTVGWSDFALFWIFIIGHIAVDHIYF